MKQFSLGRRRKPYALTVGVVFVILALIGSIAVIGFCIRGTVSILDNTKEKEAFAEVVMPVLMFDPVPYENATDLDPLFVLRSSVWAALLEKKDSYIYDDMNRMTVPSTDVDVACARLFGPDIKLRHQSFETYTAATYVYHEESKAYFVPIEAETILYTPTVIDIDKKGNTYTLIVGYIPPGNSWILRDTPEGDPQPDKYMQYVLVKNDNDTYRLAAIQDPPEGSVPELMQQQTQQNVDMTVMTPSAALNEPSPEGDRAAEEAGEDTEEDDTEDNNDTAELDTQPDNA